MAAYSYFLHISELSGCPNTTPWLILQQCLGVHWYSGLGQLFNAPLHGFFCWVLKLFVPCSCQVIPSCFQVVHHASPISPGHPAVKLIMILNLPPSVYICPHAMWL